ncbi:MAG: 50S ribosomal protein L11 methyltransferase [Dehalococcoidia bacterium]|nr:50S ribosomal protein L11 methyltransferase [Dehalococcoidia bacterium]
MTKPRSHGSSLWLEIAVEVAGMDAELAADVMRQVCPGGVAIEPSHRLDAATETYVVDGDGPAVVRGWLRAGAESPAARRSLRLALSMAPLSASGGPARWRRPRRVREESWRDAWKKHFGVLRVGRALVVAPSWVGYRQREGETVVRIDPGMAFGTGQHATTAMCLRALEEHVSPGVRVLDLGCGSGILAIAAAKLGAARVAALDTDPQAVKAARENAAANGVLDVLEVREGTLEAETSRRDVSTGGETFDLILANISGLALERLAPALAAALAGGGSLIASGFLEDAAGGLARAFGDAGLRVDQLLEEGAWRAIIAGKGADG